MRLVTVTRTHNDDDIVEAFVRHHAPQVSHFVFLDGGSGDRTLAILRSLREEGKPITVVQDGAPSLTERDTNTWLYHYADRNFSPDWVLFLDANEFIDCGRGIDELLASVPPNVHAAKLGVANYIESSDDIHPEPVIPKRMGWRSSHPDEVRVFVRGGLGPRRLVVDADGSEARIGHDEVASRIEGGALLARYPRGSAWREISESALGRLRALAAGHDGAARDLGGHHSPVLTNLDGLFERISGGQQSRANALDPSRCVFLPIRYQGGKLLFTEPTDYRVKCLRLLIQYAEQVSAEYGQLLGEIPAARERADARNRENRSPFL